MPAPLADQHSAYLRSAKDQPVHWHPWGPEVFALARQENKPVLLDIGAVWCHWCHVMDHESYEDPTVAEILNTDFVCVKVDRDERPDVDARYQRAVQALSGQGGWPLTAFLTPDGAVFYGGTYFPPEGRFGRPGFATLLRQVAEAFRKDPGAVAEQAAQIGTHLGAAAERPQRGTLTPDVLDNAASQMARAFDIRFGGFGSQPKFPHPAALDFLLARWFDSREPWTWEIVERTLSAMARGGIRDQVGGGFHRYAVDERWIVPHFEKMIYDNAALLRAYVHGAAAANLTGSPDGGIWDDAIHGVLDWTMGVMADPAGGYAASQDADIGASDDGDYFTWTPAEVREVVTDDEYRVLTRHYDIDDAGDMHGRPGRNVLWIKQPVDRIAQATGRDAAEVARLLAAGRKKLRQARARRPAPYVDRTIYTAWSAMMASAVLTAAFHLQRSDLRDHALRTLQRLYAEGASDDGGLCHAIGSDVRGLLDDQVQVAQAALDAYEATGDRRWLERVTALMDHVWERYRGEDGALLDRASGSRVEGLLTLPIQPTQDSPTPSANGIAGIVLCRLAEHTGEDRWRARSIELLESVSGGASELSVFAATVLQGMDWAIHPPTHVVIVGGEAANALHRTAVAAVRPRTVITRLAPGERPEQLPASLRAMLDGSTPRAYVCAGTACAAPVAKADRLAETLARFGVPSAS